LLVITAVCCPESPVFSPVSFWRLDRRSKTAAKAFQEYRRGQLWHAFFEVESCRVEISKWGCLALSKNEGSEFCCSCGRRRLDGSLPRGRVSGGRCHYPDVRGATSSIPTVP
jgi:hypothetical protein